MNSNKIHEIKNVLNEYEIKHAFKKIVSDN